MEYQMPNELTKHTILDCQRQLKSLTTVNQIFTINISHITKIDSAGIALLIELSQNKCARLSEPSPAVAKLAALYQINLHYT